MRFPGLETQVQIKKTTIYLKNLHYKNKMFYFVLSIQLFVRARTVGDSIPYRVTFPYSGVTPNASNMEKRIIQFKEAIHYRTAYFKEKVRYHVRRIWWRVGLLLFAAWYVNQKDMSFNLHLNAIGGEPVRIEETIAFIPDGGETPEAMNTSLLERTTTKTTARKPAESKKTPAKKRSKSDDNLANTYSNLTYTGDKIATEDKNSAKAIKRRKQRKYVERFAGVARKEMEKFGIPASITLAQGLLESNAGESPLATRNNNHFGIKCFSRSCKKGHCSNFTDDSHKDFFRKYNNAWESYRGHSYLLRADRYKPLYKLSSKDYKGWARGLKKAGYATDKYYAEKLINLIKELDLHKYDE